MEINLSVLAAFIAYFAAVLLIGYYFYNKSANLSDYVLGGRSLNPYVTALSAQASDMSGWLLLGLPGSIYLMGIGQVWIGIGLAIGSYLAWLFVAKRLRNYSHVAGDSITVSEFFSNRFKDGKGYLRTISAVVILFFFTIYVASGFVAGGNVFLAVFPGFDYKLAVILSLSVIVAYTFLGGFKAVCWTDFIQGMIMIIAIVVVPLSALGHLGGWGEVKALLSGAGSGFLNLFQNADGTSLGIIAIVSSLAWGLGYFGMPHILVRYMAIENPNDIKIARRVATTWIVVALTAACFVGVIGRAYAPGLADPETVFIVMVGGLFAPVVMGVLYSALMAAIMSTADSQLLVASAAVSNDLVAKMPSVKLGENALMWLSRVVVVVIAIIAAAIALGKSGNIMNLVSYAWAGFGAAFGPLMLTALFWKRANGKGAMAGMLVGFFTTILWNTFLGGDTMGLGFVIHDTGLYELLPGFVLSLITIVVVSLLTEKPSAEIEREFDEALV